MERLLVEGYQAAAKERLPKTKEFESADLEGWDDQQESLIGPAALDLVVGNYIVKTRPVVAVSNHK